MSRLTQDVTTKPVSRDQVLRHERGQVNNNSLFSADHEQVWQSYPVDPYYDDFTCILYLYIQQYGYVCIYMYHEYSSRAYTCTICTFVS